MIKTDIKSLLFVLGRRNLTYQRDQILGPLNLKQNLVSARLTPTQTISAIILAGKL